jgi:hypothetical protein
VQLRRPARLEHCERERREDARVHCAEQFARFIERAGREQVVDDPPPGR